MHHCDLDLTSVPFPPCPRLSWEARRQYGERGLTSALPLQFPEPDGRLRTSVNQLARFLSPVVKCIMYKCTYHLVLFSLQYTSFII